MHELYLQKYEPEEFVKLQRGETANPVVKYEYLNTLILTSIYRLVSPRWAHVEYVMNLL